MKAPKKVYFSQIENGTHYYTEAIPFERDYIEYVHKDAFIEKAADWLSNISIEDMSYKYDDFSTSESWYKFIEDFKKYMED